MFDVIGKRKWFYGISLGLTIPGLIFILLTLIPGSGLGLQFSIAYTGGTIWEVRFEETNPTPDQVQAVLVAQGLQGEVARTETGGVEYLLIRTEPLLADVQPDPEATPAPSAQASPGGSPGASVVPATAAPSTAPATAAPSAAPTSEPSPAASAVAIASPGASASPAPSQEPVVAPAIPTSGRFGDLASALQAEFGPIVEVRQQTSVGPVVSAELVQQTFLLILMGAVGIMLWITVRFKDFRMGAAALIALLHDVVVVVGLFGLLGTFTGLQVDALFVTAMLTVIGFSVHDTIVVFDRVRENRVRHAGEPFEVIVNHSILQTAGRSINTSLTVIITLSALFLMGGEAIHSFVLALLAGILIGTYSSIFVAAPLLVDWHVWDDRRRAKELSAQAAAVRAASRG